MISRRLTSSVIPGAEGQGWLLQQEQENQEEEQDDEQEEQKPGRKSSISSRRGSVASCSEQSLHWSEDSLSSRRSSISSLASSTNFNVKTGLSTSVQLSKGDRRRLQVFETHLHKHNPVQHGQRLCLQCEHILGASFPDKHVSTSPPSAYSSSYSSSSSSSHYHSDICNSYNADVSSAASSRDNFKFGFEDAPPRQVGLEGAVQLADIEYHTTRNQKYRGRSQELRSKSQELRSKPGRHSNSWSNSPPDKAQPWSNSPPEKTAKQYKVAKTHKSCVHNLAKKHRSCDVCYECKQCKEMFLKKETRGEHRNRSMEREKCSTCDTIKIKPAKEFVDCVIE